MKKFSQLLSCYKCAENYPNHYSEHDHIHGHELDLSSMCSECHSMVGHHTVVEMVSHQKICDECNLRYRLNFHHNPFKFNCTSKSDTVNWWQISRLQNAIACNVNAIVVVLTSHLTVTLLAVLEAFNNFFYCHTWTTSSLGYRTFVSPPLASLAMQAPYPPFGSPLRARAD